MNRKGPSLKHEVAGQQAGSVFDRMAGLDGVPGDYRAMDT